MWSAGAGEGVPGASAAVTNWKVKEYGHLPSGEVIDYSGIPGISLSQFPGILGVKGKKHVQEIFNTNISKTISCYNNY
jgi:hypothetical protein